LDPNIDPEILAALDEAETWEDAGGDLLDDFIVDAQTVNEESAEELALKDVAYTDCFGNEFIPDWQKSGADDVKDTPYQISAYDREYAESDDEYSSDESMEGGGARTVRTGHVNVISTPFQRHFNAISTPFQRC